MLCSTRNDEGPRNGAALEVANSATEHISQQIATHNIAGTLVIAASCTHRNASMLAPLYLDVDKATRGPASAI